MTLQEVPQSWSSRFGLARVPLFGDGDAPDGADHSVLLDGGYGTFALSTSENGLWRETETASWVWSGNIPHHVTVTEEKVAVLRWDRPLEKKTYNRSSVEQNLDKFHQFLSKDRLRSSKTITEHLLGFFRRVRSLCYSSGVPDRFATDVFLAGIAGMIAPDRALTHPEEFGLSGDTSGLLDEVGTNGLAAAIEEMSRSTGSLSGLELHPSIAVRHAGGTLFQEAHFELLRGYNDLDLFDLVPAAETTQRTRGGAHFTPPALARTVVEQSLNIVEGISERDSITICDPACGSGAFLHEALRALSRLGFNGRLTVIGQDISEPAVSMARFALRMSLRDWSPVGGFELRLNVGDSLGDLGMPAADVILMNPPFVSFGAQSKEQRHKLAEILGAAASARGDLSMAFIVRALDALNNGGVLGTLFPASLLSSKAASRWRTRLAENGDVRLIASIGDFGLFTHAQVQVACSVIAKGRPAQQEVTALVTGNDQIATGQAFRWLRKEEQLPPAIPVTEEGWSVFSVPNRSLADRPTWRFPTPSQNRLLKTLRDSGLPIVADLFRVNQGIQTGLNKALLLDQRTYRSLPKKEQKFFRKATMSHSIQGGRIVKPYFVFFPHTKSGGLFADEYAVKSALPEYFRKFLEPNKVRLVGRATIVRSGRTDWWGLMRHRDWSFQNRPRIISKFFAAEGGFVGDYNAEFLPVMGHIWFPTDRLITTEENPLDISDILAAYVVIFNSPFFIRLLEIFSPHVAGGQFDLSWRYVRGLPTPDLRSLSQDIYRGRLCAELAKLGHTIDLANPSWCNRSDQLVSELYGTQAFDGN